MQTCKYLTGDPLRIEYEERDRSHHGSCPLHVALCPARLCLRAKKQRPYIEFDKR